MARAGIGRPGLRTALVTRFGAWLDRPLASFHLILSIAALLSILGLVMVLSASSVSEYTRSGSAYSMFIRQLVFIAVGWIAFYLALRTPVRVLRRTAFLGLVLTAILLALVLVPGIGVLVNGARSWFHVGPFAFQPSELAKISLALWGAVLLADRGVRTRNVRDMLIPLVPGALIIFTLVALQPDFSTLVVLFFILLSLLWFAGLPLGYFVVGVGSILSVAMVMAVAEGYRTQRLRSFFNADDDPLGASYQARQAKFSLADGGLFGVGLGQSRAKWKFLPEAHNDFIFAIIGEELGFVGAVAVLGIFALFTYTGLRIAARSVDPFLRLFVATSTVWIIGQAFINLGYVVGLLPVTGLQLPLISAGGSSTVLTLLMFGLMANAARHEPEAIAALRLASKNGKGPKILRLPLPEKYQPPKPIQRREPSRADYDDARRYGVPHDVFADEYVNPRYYRDPPCPPPVAAHRPRRNPQSRSSGGNASTNSAYPHHRYYDDPPNRVDPRVRAPQSNSRGANSRGSNTRGSNSRGSNQPRSAPHRRGEWYE
ncbi:putative lipid II flippase FtsW [Hoyosella rhizosphaerae]|uniref:Probable peptidoglycan glycosyltransferase FtsW n=1 Tax=Hoyosella rhizosphaerae TaxID=1755582 RepID=A0A916UFL5_9ACTN|nr:putative lipid II flippase FtsW [Hoyosella rhizosphaerae]MBN4927914.1 putative lipid II flippase FtsW [Hoyosella rhizosphaerae]GGC70958.1 putative lipid II flippase FtsW [Hoyosella rhizosphaerae]